jgi:hypothetical protein
VTLSQQEKNNSADVQRSKVHIAGFISPAHKRTEGRVPVWGSEFTTKIVTLQGDSADFAARLNVYIWVLTARLPDYVPVSPLFRISAENMFRKLKSVSMECDVAGCAGAMRAIAPCWGNARHRPKRVVEGTPPRGLTYHFTDIA